MFRPVLETGPGKRINVDRFAIIRLIAAGALFLALRRWPYSYYTMLRWTVCIVAAFGAFQAFDVGRRTWAWIFVSVGRPIQSDCPDIPCAKDLEST